LLEKGVARLPSFAVVGIAGVVLFLPSLFLPPLNPVVAILQTCKYTILCSNAATPWGIVTGIFLFDGWANVNLYLELLVIFVISNVVLPPLEISKRSAFCVILIFASAIISAATWLLIRPWTESYGPSAVVYAFIGFVIGMSLLNVVPRGRTLADFRAYYSSFSNVALGILNLLVAGVILTQIFLSPDTFLSVGPNVNVFEHGVSFLIAFGSACVYSIVRSGRLLLP
jgi:hypothetical protein